MSAPPTWTRAEHDTLIDHWALGGAAVCGPLIPGHKVVSIRRRASHLGLKRVYPEPEPVVEPEPEPIAIVQPARPVREPMSFEDQLAAVRNGAGLVEVRQICWWPEPSFTLGGVSAGMM